MDNLLSSSSKASPVERRPRSIEENNNVARLSAYKVDSIVINIFNNGIGFDKGEPRILIIDEVKSLCTEELAYAEVIYNPSDENHKRESERVLKLAKEIREDWERVKASEVEVSYRDWIEHRLEDWKKMTDTEFERGEGFKW